MSRRINRLVKRSTGQLDTKVSCPAVDFIVQLTLLIIWCEFAAVETLYFCHSLGHKPGEWLLEACGDVCLPDIRNLQLCQGLTSAMRLGEDEEVVFSMVAELCHNVVSFCGSP